MDIQTALKATGKAVRACWAKSIVEDCVVILDGVLVYSAVDSPVPLDVVLSDDWESYPEKERCGECLEKEKVVMAIVKGREEGFAATPVWDAFIDAVYFILEDLCTCEAAKKPVPGKPYLRPKEG